MVMFEIMGYKSIMIVYNTIWFTAMYRVHSNAYKFFIHIFVAW